MVLLPVRLLEKGRVALRRRVLCPGLLVPYDSERGTFTYSVASSQTYVWHLAFHHRWYRKIQAKSPSLRTALGYIDRYGGGEPPSRIQILAGPMSREGKSWRDVVTVFRRAVMTSAPAAVFRNFGEFTVKLYRFFVYESPKHQSQGGAWWRTRLETLNSLTRSAAAGLTLLGLLGIPMTLNPPMVSCQLIPAPGLRDESSGCPQLLHDRLRQSDSKLGGWSVTQES